MNMDVQRARQLRSNPTDAERQLWRYLCRRQMHGVRFRRQQPIGPYIVDFISFEAGLIIEIDGGQHQEQSPYDDRRSRWLEHQGYRVLRYWNNEVMGDIEAVLTDIARYLSPPP